MNPALFNPLGAIEDAGSPAAWAAFLKGQRDSVQAAWLRAEAARLSLKKVREVLNLPFIVNSPTEAGAPGAWNDDFEKNMLELKAIATGLVQYADEALANKRPLVYQQNTGEFGIGAIDGDTLRIELSPVGRPQIVNAATGQVITNFEGSLGLPPLAIGAIVVVAGLVIYAVTEKICSTVETTAKQKTIETISTDGKKLIAEGKATPEQVAMIDKALFEGQATVTKAEGEKAKDEGQWPSTIRTVALVGLGIAAVWLVGNMFASRGGGSSLALARSAA